MGRMLSSSARPVVDQPRLPLGAPLTPTLSSTPTNPTSQAQFQLLAQYQTDPFRKVAFYSSLCLLFVRFAVLPEVIYYITGVNTYLLYFVAPIAILGALLAGGVKRTFRYPAPYLWSAFFVWMIVAPFFSCWRGGSFAQVKEYGRIEFLFLIVVGGLAINWKEIRLIFYTIGAAAMTNLLTARLFLKMDNGRVSLQASGTIGNSNDLAAHLLLVLPFLLFIVMDSKRTIFVRLAIFGSIGYGLWLILGTASRGALVAVLAALVFFLWHASLRQRLGVILATLLLAGIYLAFLPDLTKDRLTRLFDRQNEEASESSASRAYLIKKSLQFTMERPLFGVGPDQFSNYEGKSSQMQGEHGNWHETHCTWTEVSSECGIPALIFFVGGITSALLLVRRSFQTARRQGHADIANACFCYLLAMVGFLVAVTFLASAYKYYFPAMIGLAAAISFATNAEMAARDAIRGASLAKS